MERKASTLFATFARLVNSSSSGFTAMLSAYDFARGPAQQIVIAALNGDPVARKMMQKVQGLFLPRRVLLYSGGEGEREGRLRELCPYWEDKTALQGKATAYLCLTVVRLLWAVWKNCSNS